MQVMRVPFHKLGMCKCVEQLSFVQILHLMQNNWCMLRWLWFTAADNAFQMML